MRATQKKKIADLVVGNKTAEAIKLLTNSLEKSKASQQHLPALQAIAARQQKLVEDNVKGLLYRDEEEVRQNRINNDLLTLLENIGKQKDVIKKEETAPQKSTTPISGPPKKSPKTWIWLLIGAFGIYLIYSIIIDEPIEVENAKLCSLPDLSLQCCAENMNRLTISEANTSLNCTILLNNDLPDPIIKGLVNDQHGNIVTQTSLTKGLNAVCYTGRIQLPQGYSWQAGRYAVKFLVNDQPAGFMEFTVIP